MARGWVGFSGERAIPVRRRLGRISGAASAMALGGQAAGMAGI